MAVSDKIPNTNRSDPNLFPGPVLEFEKPVIELEIKIGELQAIFRQGNVGVADEIKRLEKKAERLRREVYSNLSPWQRVQLARHPNRPYTLDYIKRISPGFIELHGDRTFADDKAIVAGLAPLDGRSVVLVGHQKGRDTKERLYRNFGQPHPEGYRKTRRVMELAAKFGKPVVTLVDTPGAYPGIGAEERGQAEAIAKNLFTMSRLQVPILVVIIGEGGSGGALALGVGNRVLMLENAIYSVISPEGCASILYRDAGKAEKAAENLKLTPLDLLKMGIIDGIIPEPLGGAHRDVDGMAEILKKRILDELDDLGKIPVEELIERRLEKFGRIGFWEE